MENRINWKVDWFDIIQGNIIVKYTKSLKDHLIKNKIIKYECEICKVKKWNGFEITLDMDHIDGNTWNNKLDNLRLLCPNCHSQTNTFKGKNKQNKIKKGIKGNEEKIIELYSNGKNINQILNILKINTGGNYNIIYKLLKDNCILIENKVFDNIQPTTIDEKISKHEYRINLINSSNINFGKSGWGIELGKLLNMHSSSARRWIQRELPNIWEKSWKQK
jgi:Zn finger protein HypA/HybF involved in hydrogenase expression